MQLRKTPRSEGGWEWLTGGVAGDARCLPGEGLKDLLHHERRDDPAHRAQRDGEEVRALPADPWLGIWVVE